MHNAPRESRKRGKSPAIRNASGIGIEGVKAVFSIFTPAIRITHDAERERGNGAAAAAAGKPAASVRRGPLDRVYVFIFWFPFDSSAKAR